MPRTRRRDSGLSLQATWTEDETAPATPGLLPTNPGQPQRGIIPQSLAAALSTLAQAGMLGAQHTGMLSAQQMGMLGAQVGGALGQVSPQTIRCRACCLPVDGDEAAFLAGPQRRFRICPVTQKGNCRKPYTRSPNLSVSTALARAVPCTMRTGSTRWGSTAPVSIGVATIGRYYKPRLVAAAAQGATAFLLPLPRKPPLLSAMNCDRVRGQHGGGRRIRHYRRPWRQCRESVP